ncbi:MAG: agmatine deiminase family protein [Rhodospirillaceae bacterium]|nr:agmatine deiminase family protein [Rhodospirillaceae bacterium]
MVSKSGIGTPHQDGFYLPADAARLGRLWLSWPRDALARAAIVPVAKVLADAAPVSVIAAPGQEHDARAALGDMAAVEILEHCSLRLRDTGPTFLVDGKGGAAAVDWRFNGWGERLPADPTDETFAHTLLGFTEVRRFRAPLTLEGSAFTGDGLDTLLALAPAVFDPARNPGLPRLEAFAILQQWLGVARVIWLEHAHPRDRLVTDVRALAAFAAPGVVLVSQAPEGRADAQVLTAVAHDLKRTRDAQGKHLDIVALPAPAAATPVPASYTGFLTINGVVLVPAYDEPGDERARDILAEQFRSQDVRLVPALELAKAGLTLAGLALPHPARLLERDRASILPRSAWSQSPPDVDAMLQKYIDLAAEDS